MGCSSCGSLSGITQIKRIIRNNTPILDCIYTQDMLTDWLTTFKCVKTKNISALFNLTVYKLNSYLGIIQSALNYSTNPCYFKPKLDEISPLIDTIKTNGQC